MNMKYLISYPELDSVLRLFILNDCSQLEVMFEGAGDMVGCLASLDTALDT